MSQMSLTGTVSYAPECVFCDLKVNDVATEEYRSYLTRTAKKGAWPTDPRDGSGKIVVRCPICELEFVSTVYELPDKVLKKLENTWVKDEFSVDLL